MRIDSAGGRRHVRLTVLATALCLAVPAAAQDYRVAGGMSLPRDGTIGGQVQASAELGPRTSGFGVRVDLLYSQTPSRALSVGDLVFGGQSTRTMAAVGGLFYRREVRDFAPYLLAGGGAYEQTGTAGVALGVHGGVGVDYAGARYRPFVEARMHRLQGAGDAEVLQHRERSLISALFGFRF
ncbi:MAG: hypothetical protein IPF98_02625 [Gemmatimonadetes bacterium]|nr:hypothetical protein [Gemmatimonadota bacterium]MCC6771348.1 hypothetical protein [Gemmatimonadaceae bacterium]